MGILEDHSADLKANAMRDFARPAPQLEPEFSMGGLVTPGAIGAGALEGIAGVSDFLSGFGFDTALASLESNPIPDKPGVRPLGRELRRGASAMMPDPLTAHWSSQAVAGLAKAVTKAGASMALAGPTVGAVLFGLGEASDTAQRLQEDGGVEPDVAWTVGGVVGVASAIGARLPISGADMAKTAAGKVAATVGLATAGGPLTYVVQESLARDILQFTGHPDEARKHDPTDPIGLMASMFPFAIGGAHLYGRLRRGPEAGLPASAAPIERLTTAVESVESNGRRYAADGSILTSPKGAQGEMQVMPKTATDPGYGVTPAKDNSPEELARVGRDYLAAMRQKYGNDEQAAAAYNAGPGAVDAAIKAHGDNWLSALPKETRDYVAKVTARIEAAPAEPAPTDAAPRAAETAPVDVAPPAEAAPEVWSAADAAAQTAAPDAVPSAVDPEVQAVADAARVDVLSQTVAKSLPEDPAAHVEMVKAADAVAAGERVGASSFEELAALEPDPTMPKAADVADDLRHLAQGAGWAQEGGRIIRSGVSEAGDQGMGGAVVGRTKWIPHEEWFARMRALLGRDGLSNPEAIQAAVEKAIAGEKLKAAEKRTVDWMLSEVQQMRDALWRLDDAGAVAQDAFDAGLSSRYTADIELASRAAEVNPDAVERAAIQFENDADGFRAEMERILREHVNQATPNSGAGTGGRGAEARQAAAAEAAASRAAPEKGLTLTAQTVDELKAKAEDQAQARAADAAAQKRLADKAAADAALGDFTLTGSDRQADANPNQGGLFDDITEPSGNSLPDSNQVGLKPDAAPSPKPAEYPEASAEKKAADLKIRDDAIKTMRKQIAVMKALRECVMG